MKLYPADILSFGTDLSLGCGAPCPSAIHEFLPRNWLHQSVRSITRYHTAYRELSHAHPLSRTRLANAL